MVRRAAFVALVAATATAGAQTPPPTAATLCRQEGQAEQTRLINADRTAGKTPDVTAIVNAAKKVTRDCAAKIDASTATVRERGDLASLYVYTGDTAKAEHVVDDMLKAKGSEADRAEALAAGVRLAIAKWDPFAGRNRQAEKLLADLDRLSDGVIATKISAHTMMLGRYDYADNDEGLRLQATQLLALAKRALELNAMPMTQARPAQGDRPAVPAVSGAYMPMLNAYSSLARAEGDYLHADSALMVLDEGIRVVGSAFPPAKSSLEANKKMYQLVGTTATPVSGRWWVNAADNTTAKLGDGKVSILQFTAHWCVPCKQSYPPMLRLMGKYKGKPVESVMVTGLYGFLGDQRDMTPEQEVAADREYYAQHHHLPFPVAINPAPARGQQDDNEARYAVGGIPEIVIIDRKGVIRATVVGWDKGNEARFASLIDKLLAER